MDAYIFCDPPIPIGNAVRSQQLGTRQGKVNATVKCLVCSRFADLSFAGIFLWRIASRSKRDSILFTCLVSLSHHMEFLLAGWLIQLAMGVAFWVIPRFSSGSSRGPVGLGWLSFALINSGILITALQFWFPVAVLVGRIAEVLAGIFFVIGSWRRIKPHGVL